MTTITKERRDEIAREATIGTPFRVFGQFIESIVNLTLKELGIEVAEPAPRPYTLDEISPFVGRGIWKSSPSGMTKYGTSIVAVSESGVAVFNGRVITFQELREEYYWDIGLSEPCGIVSPADAQGVR